MQYHKLIDLLSQTWASPLFTDSYPQFTAAESEPILRQIKTIHADFVAVLRPLLAAGMPEATEAEVAAITHQVGPKSTAFCAAVAAADIDDVPRLRAAAVSIALAYWCDQSMDRGDEAMVTAVYALNSQLNGTSPFAGDRSLTPLAARRLHSLQAIDGEIRQLSRPEDTPWLWRAVFDDMLVQQADMRQLSQRYLVQPDKDAFWERYADEAARLSIYNGGFVYVVAAIYAIYRCHRPHLPGLQEIFAHEQVVSFIQGLGSAAIRAWDDWGDRYMDSGARPEWGDFYLNVFNQTDSRFLTQFLRYAEVDDCRTADTLIAAFQSEDEAGYNYVADVFVNLLRERMAAFPPPVWDRYAVFLTLAKRVLEAGYINAVGDMELAETGDS